MILVDKPAAPRSLDAGVAETDAYCADFDADPRAYRDGQKTFSFKRSIYGSSRVKNALKHAQKGKCCFCEARFDANYRGDVEHYRPKGAIGSGATRIRPGYYWLAYTWTNLYYACADCNQYQKRAAFPLVDETKRASDHHSGIADEDPLILDPGGPRDPRDHIRFNGDVPTGVTSAGRETISLLKLDREALCRDRREHFRILQAMIDIIRLMETDQRPKAIECVSKARSELANSVKPESKFSAASQDFLAPFRQYW